MFPYMNVLTGVFQSKRRVAERHRRAVRPGGLHLVSRCHQKLELECITGVHRFHRAPQDYQPNCAHLRLHPRLLPVYILSGNTL